MTTMSGSMETMAEVEDDELDVGDGVAAVVEWMRLAGVRMVVINWLFDRLPTDRTQELSDVVR